MDSWLWVSKIKYKMWSTGKGWEIANAVSVCMYIFTHLYFLSDQSL